MNIIVLGGDGFCGWPVSLHLANAGHNVMIVDSLTRRPGGDTYSPSLTPIASVEDRVNAAGITFQQGWANDYDFMYETIRSFKPQTIIHFAEQRSAPWSMISGYNRLLTVGRNVSSTQAVLECIAQIDPNIHLVHLGTMGVYGYSSEPDADPIPEGYVEVTIGGKVTRQDGHLLTEGGVRQSVVYPGNPGSVYHMTKVLDHTMFQFYAKNYGVKITDLHQGIVWGTETEDTKANPIFTNRFDYDGEYGTVLNRFLMQAAYGSPLTVYGSGGQTRAFIHIQDTVRCVRTAVENTDCDFTRPRIFNQTTECLNVLELANLIDGFSGCGINLMENPRKELAANDLRVESTLSTVGGFTPLRLDDNTTLVNEAILTVKANLNRVDPSLIQSKASWHTAS